MHVHMLFPQMIPCLVEMKGDTEQDTTRGLMVLIAEVTQDSRGGRELEHWTEMRHEKEQSVFRCLHFNSNCLSGDL